MANYILSIDQGTTSSRAVLFSNQGQVVMQAQQEFEQLFPNDGWVEHRTSDIWQTVLDCCLEVIEKAHITASDIAAIGITNQRETTVVWDKQTGQPIYNAIVWQDRRTSEYCRSLKSQQLEPLITEKTGLLLDPYFCATKIKWILDTVEGARAKAEQGQLAFGTIDSFLLWHLTGGESHATDATNASRTLLFNIHQQDWDKELLELFDIPASMLPKVLDCAADFGESKAALFGESIKIAGMAGDQQAALFGQACFEKGMAKSTYGTGCFLMLNTGYNPIFSSNRLLTTVAYRLNGQVNYAVEGSIFMAGATVQWLRDGLQVIDDAKDSEALAQQVKVDHGVFLVPAFTGLGAPYWDPDARGGIVGLTRDSGIKEIVSAGLQSVCYQTKDLQKAMERDGVRPTNLRVDGGLSANNWVMQFLSDMLDAPIERGEIIETTALGVAYLAGLQTGLFKSLEHLAKLRKADRVFKPSMSEQQRNSLYQQWLIAVNRMTSSSQ